MAISVMIFEDNRKFRESLSVLIDGSPGFTVAGAFPDANLAVENITKNKPDVVLMDIEMPGISGIEGLKKIRKAFPALCVLMQTVFEDDDKIFESICNGASGYILKNTPPVRMLEAIHEALEGGAPMTPVIAKRVLHLLQHGNNPPSSDKENFYLTPREKEILTHMVDGMSYKMIAAECKISYETVRSHIKNIYEKLHVVTMTEAVAKAIKSKLV